MSISDYDRAQYAMQSAAGAVPFTPGNVPALTMVGSITQSDAPAITAAAGGGQANATPLTKQLNRVAIVATPGDSVLLPAAVAGMTISIVNDAANPMQVIGAGTDTINGVAAATGVAQMQKSIVYYSCTVAGAWVAEGIGCGYAGSLPTVSAANGLTATAAGTQATALLLGAVINRVTVVATIGDATKLPVAAPGLSVTVTNAAAASMNVFPNTGDSVNGAAANTAYPLAAGKTASFTSAAAGIWHAVLSA